MTEDFTLTAVPIAPSNDCDGCNRKEAPRLLELYFSSERCKSTGGMIVRLCAFCRKRLLDLLTVEQGNDPVLPVEPVENPS